MRIEYPPLFEQLLQSDRTLRAGIDTLTNIFDGWISTSKVPFFTDYTDHGIEHLNAVLATAENLMSKPARDLITPADAATLIAAVLFHDSAMHISEAGFESLIRGSSSTWAVNGFHETRWPTLWDEFLFTAKRWDDRKLAEVFGEKRDGRTAITVRDPFDSYDNLTDADRKLIGEFIRRNHPRMAHEFAYFGVPGKSLITVAQVLNSELRDMAGLVARSHGLPVRSCVDYLNSKYHRREYMHVHAVYLMTLLRLADYLQIQSSRAPHIVFQYRHIASKASQLEWSAHAAVKNITQTHDDPESIEIQAYPENVHVYLRLTEWLSGIQDELDASWAVLGETYGSHESLSRLGLILRRVRSNLDDAATFASHVIYVPERIELAVARPDLLKLLVGPLYDNEPSIGVRELVQNAVDAVRERTKMQERHPELGLAELLDQENDVEVWLDDPNEHGESWLTVSDKGVGMTPETIRDYFLTAGASFRRSDAWRREFEADTEPTSRVLRSGRFGVGILAGFLLGPSMEVSTRHIHSKTGVKFTITLDVRDVSLVYDHSLQVGTTIRILVSEQTRNTLLESSQRVSTPARFDWYVYDSPVVQRFVGGSRRPLTNRNSIHGPEHRTRTHLRKLNVPLPYSVFWTFKTAPNLSVNGIYITTTATRGRYTRDRDWQYPVHINYPNVLIEDPDGMFPLNLRRSDITEREYPFNHSLKTDVVDDFLAYILVNSPTVADLGQAGGFTNHPAVNLSHHVRDDAFSVDASPWVLTTDGSSFTYLPWLWAGASQIYTVSVCPESAQMISSMLASGTALVTAATPQWAQKWIALYPEQRADASLLAALAFVFPTSSYEGFMGFLGKSWIITGIRLVIPRRVQFSLDKAEASIRRYDTAFAAIAASDRYIQLPNLDSLAAALTKPLSKLGVELSGDVYQVLSTPGLADTHPFLPGRYETATSCAIEIVMQPVETGPAADSQFIVDRWQAVFQRPTIPYSLADRKRELGRAYEELARFVSGYEAQAARRTGT